MKWKFELVAGPYGSISEGPVWDGRYVYFTLIGPGLIMRYDPRTGDCIEWRSGTRQTNGLAFDAQGRLYGCSSGARALMRFDPDGRNTVILDRFNGKRLGTPNDLAVDRRGRIWFTNPWNENNADPGDTPDYDDQQVLRADPLPDGSWSVTQVTFDTTFPNGILVSADQRTLYVSQQDYDAEKPRELRAYPINENGSLGKYIVLHQFGTDYRGVHRGIDGMCLDVDGNIIAIAGWIRSGPGPMVYVFSPTGRVLETHPMPAEHPTNCTFGDPDMHTLYACSAAGHLFRIRTDRQGWYLYP